MSKIKIEIEKGTMGHILTDYLAEEPDKREICPMVMILLDYYTDDNSEEHRTITEFMDNAYRKRSMLQGLIERWKKEGK